MRYKIKEIKRGLFKDVNNAGIAVLEDDDSFKSLIFDDVDAALELRDKLNEEIRSRIENLEQ